MGESGEKTSYFRNGVIVTQPEVRLYTTDGESDYIITSPDIESLPDLKDGDCFQVEFKANFTDTPDKNVYSVEVNRLYPVPALNIESTKDVLPDTIPSANEQLMTINFRKGQFIKDRFFVPIELLDYRQDQSELFSFKYNPDTLTVDTITKHRIYELYVRSIREGGVDSIKIREHIQMQALVLDNFLEEVIEREKEAQEDSVFFRFKYPNKFNVDSTLLRWTQTDIYSIKL